jgi:uncharacterized DUF497 family protein
MKRSASNIRKHAIDLRDVPEVFDNATITTEDDRFEYGERRSITLGLLRGRVVVVVHTERDDVTQIISARKATRYEQISFFRRLAD